MTELVPYTVRLYRSGPKADTFTDEELDRIQQGHLDFLAATRDSIHANGPFDGQPDQSLRGYAVMRTGIEETLAAVKADPAVVAGRMRAEVFTWLVPRGMLPFEP
jgi:hypothetical protein